MAKWLVQQNWIDFKLKKHVCSHISNEHNEQNTSRPTSTDIFSLSSPRFRESNIFLNVLGHAFMMLWVVGILWLVWLVALCNSALKYGEQSQHLKCFLFELVIRLFRMLNVVQHYIRWFIRFRRRYNIHMFIDIVYVYIISFHFSLHVFVLQAQITQS